MRMNFRKMILTGLLASACCFSAGSTALAEGGSYADAAAASLQEASGIREELITEAEKMAEKSSVITEAYRDKSAAVTQNMLDTYAEDCRTASARAEEMQEEAKALYEALPPAEDQELGRAAEAWFGELQTILADYREVLDFYCDQYDAQAALVKALNTPQNDPQVYLSLAYNAMSQTQEAFRALHKPSCLEDNWKCYTDSIDGFLRCMVSEAGGLAYDDVLRRYSAAYVLDRLDRVLSNYDGNNFDLMGREYRQVISVANGRLKEAEENLLSLVGGTGTAEEVFPRMKTNIDYEMIDTIYPNLYNSTNSVVNLTACTDGGTRDILITCQLNEFTQTYSRKVTIDEAVTSIQIKPPVLMNLPNLKNGWDTLLMLTVTDASTNELLVQESKTIHINSIYDFQLRNDEFGINGHDDLLAWLQPESEAILALRRGAIEWLSKVIGSNADALPGYQGAYGMKSGNTDITAYQTIALQAVVSAIGVRYNNGGFSLASDTHQRVLLPADVLSSSSGICVETSLVIASAILSADMHPMLILTPGHCQVAVESWDASGDYFLVETTTLPFKGTDDIDEYILLLTDEEWVAYLQDAQDRGKMYVLDCDLVNTLGIQGLNYDTGMPLFTMPDFSDLSPADAPQEPTGTGPADGPQEPTDNGTGDDRSSGGGFNPSSGGDDFAPAPGNDDGAPKSDTTEPGGGSDGGSGDTVVHHNDEGGFSFSVYPEYRVEDSYGFSNVYLTPDGYFPSVYVAYWKTESPDAYAMLQSIGETVMENHEVINAPSEPQPLPDNPGCYVMTYSYEAGMGELRFTDFAIPFDKGVAHISASYYPDSDAEAISAVLTLAFNTLQPDPE